MDLHALNGPVLLRGNENTAYRDPAVVLHQGVFYLYFTLVETEDDGRIFLYTAMCTSLELQNFSPVVKLTPRDRSLNFSSPGNIIRYGGEWIMCLQTYPRPDGEKYANADARVWLMKSPDLLNWSEPEILAVKGKGCRFADMDRMIDPYLLQDKDVPGKHWCFYKQNGVSLSYSHDLKEWTYHGCTAAGENVCIIVKDGRYLLFHSPENGIGVLVSDDLQSWGTFCPDITLGQKDWDWARGRLTAGFVLDCRNKKEIGKYLLFFHATGPENEDVLFDTHACIGLAWSDDLLHWEWAP